MVILNLDENFKPVGEGIPFKKLSFPSGCEPHLILQSVIVDEKAIITCRIKTSEDIILILLATDALRRSGVRKIRLFMPYLPFARQDRVMVPGEPLSVKVIADLINSQNYDKVYLFDVHSDVGSALINNSEVLDNHYFVKNLLKDKKDYLIISPDAGSYKKIFKLCQSLNYTDDIILCNKVRDVSNGDIKSLTFNENDLKGKDCYIIDDICSRGGTFMALAKALKEHNAGKVYLIVSHYENSANIESLKDAGIEHIYTTNTLKDIDEPFITQVKLKRALN